jgi:hypothetical protein
MCILHLTGTSRGCPKVSLDINQYGSGDIDVVLSTMPDTQDRAKQRGD